VTIFAGGHSVNPYEGKLGFIVIELDLLAPTLLVVALIAFFPFLPFMNVIGFMTVIAELAQFFLIGVAPVAGQTHQLGMATLQLEFGVLVMIEFHLGPFDKAMAFVAFFTHAPFVIVITPVTVDAFPLQFFLEIASLVTGIAFRLIVSTTKRKLGFIMIELGLRPTGGAMTFVTFFPKASCMNVVQ
jgi:hypothetical protein